MTIATTKNYGAPRKSRKLILSSLSFLVLFLSELTLVSPEVAPVEPEDVTFGDHYSPFVGRAYLDQVLFGDMHFHTET